MASLDPYAVRAAMPFPDEEKCTAVADGLGVQTSLLHGSISELRDALAQLGDRLSPVLRPPSPEVLPKDELPSGAECPAATELRCERGRIEQTIREVHDLLFRLNL